MLLDVQVARTLLLWAAFTIQQLIQVDAAHLYRVVVVMVVNASVAKQATGAAGRSASATGTKSPRLIRGRSDHVIQEDGPIFELLHAGQMVHQLGRQGFHVGIKVLLDALPLARLIECDNGRREEEQQASDDGQQQGGGLPVPHDILGAFLVPRGGGLLLKMLMPLLGGIVAIVQAAMRAIFPAFLLPVPLLVLVFRPRQPGRQVHVQILHRTTDRVHVLLAGPHHELLLVANPARHALGPLRIPPAVRIANGIHRPY